MKRRLMQYIVAGLCLAAVAVLAGCTYFGTTNAPPVASIEAEPTSGHTPLAVAFSGAGSTDSDGTIVAWLWDFGDTQTGEGALTVHAFTTQTLSSVYTVILTVVDNDGARDSDAVNITVRP